MYVVNRLNKRNTHLFLWNMSEGNHLAKKKRLFFLTALCFERKTSRRKNKMPRALQLCHFKIYSMKLLAFSPSSFHADCFIQDHGKQEWRQLTSAHFSGGKVEEKFFFWGYSGTQVRLQNSFLSVIPFGVLLMYCSCMPLCHHSSHPGNLLMCRFSQSPQSQLWKGRQGARRWVL